jgi:hypothetical protein
MKVNIGWWREWVLGGGSGTFAPMHRSPILHTAFIEWVFIWTIGPLFQSELMGQGGGQSSPYAGTSNKSMWRPGDGGGSSCYCYCCYILSAGIASCYNTYIYMSARESESTWGLHVKQGTKENYTMHQCWCSSCHGEIFNILKMGIHSLAFDEYTRWTARDIIYTYVWWRIFFLWLRAELWPVVCNWLGKEVQWLQQCFFVVN